MDFLGDDSGSEVDFTINQDYAKKYERWRRGEEIQKLKDKYGDVEDSSDSTSEEEDEDGKELTEDVEKQFYKTLSCLKEKNPKIYDQNVRFFEEKNQDKEVKEKNEENKKRDPSLSLAGYQRKVLLETGGQFSDHEEDEEKPFEMMSSQDQENDIKQSFKDVLKDSDNEDEAEWGNLFTKRIKTAEEIEKEEEDFRQWLAGEKEKLKDSEIKEELKGLHDYWANPKLDEAEKFLRDYVLNKRYLEHDDKKRIPSYDEIVHDSDSNLSADDDTLNQQEEFEKKYNFRFEEPDREFIKRYPRTLEQSMRKKDDKRKKHREEVKQRKQTERSKKDEELKRLKTLKKKEIMDKIKKLQHITGNEDIAFQTEDLEGDFDPEEHDKRMSQIFNEEYYGTGGDDEYPEMPEYDEDLETENWDNWDGRNEQEEDELHCEDPDFNMDCDYDPTKKKELQKELIENSRRRKNRRKSKFAEALEREKPLFNPKDKTFEQYVDEYYALDYEDLIGDIPCRFKYRKVVPNDYGLTIDEILNASDQELNRWVSIKKITRRLPEHVELYDVKAYKRKASNSQKKAKCFPSLYGPKSDDWEVPGVEINREFKNRKNNSNSTDQTNEVDTEEPTTNTGSEPKEGKKKKNKKKKSSTLDDESDFGRTISENGSESATPFPEEENTRTEKKKKKKQSLDSGGTIAENVSECSGHIADEESAKTEKKKKKRKMDNEIGESLPKSDVVNAEANDGGTGVKEKRKKPKTENGWITEPIENDKPTNANNGVQNGTDTGKKKKKRKKKGKGEKSQSEGSGQISFIQNGKKRKHCAIEDKGSNQKWSKTEGKGHKKRKMNYNQQNNELCNLSDERLKSYGLNPKKYKNKLKYKNKNKVK